MRKPVYAICEKLKDQPTHPCSLISTFIVCYLDSIIPLLAIAEISRLKLVSAAEQAGLSLNWWETPKTGFLVNGSYSVPCKAEQWMEVINCHVLGVILPQVNKILLNYLQEQTKTLWFYLNMSHLMTKPTSDCAPSLIRVFAVCWVPKDRNFLHTDSKDSDQTGQMLDAHAILLVLSWGGSIILFLTP